MHLGPRGQIGRAFPHHSLLSALLLLTLSLVPGSRVSAEERSGPARDDGGEPRVAAKTSRTPVATTRATATSPKAPLTRIAVPSTAPGDRATVMIDAGTSTAAPTASEGEKLAVARARVERARAAGTLLRPRPARPEAALPVDWEARKRALTSAQKPRPFADDAAAGVGPLPSVQKRGPAGLSPAEQAKLKAPQSPKDRDPNEGGR